MNKNTTNIQVKLTTLVDPKARKRLIDLKELLIAKGFGAQEVSPGKLLSVLVQKDTLKEQLALLEQHFHE